MSFYNHNGVFPVLFSPPLNFFPNSAYKMLTTPFFSFYKQEISVHKLGRQPKSSMNKYKNSTKGGFLLLRPNCVKLSDKKMVLVLCSGFEMVIRV